MPHELERLVIGDVVSEGGHTMMYVGRCPAEGSPRGGFAFVDVYPSSGLSMVKSQTNPMWFGAMVYRCADQALPPIAARYAMIWANRNALPPTSYAVGRAPEHERTYEGAMPDRRSQGVTEELERFKREEKAQPGSGTSPPMEFDALYRVLKWSQRTDKPFSANRGATCCAFVMACYQVASIVHCAGDHQGRIAVALEGMKSTRGPRREITEKDLVKTPSDGLLSPAAFRAFSNRGSTGQETFDVAASRVLSEIAGKPVRLEDVFSPPLRTDAKYMQTKLLLNEFNKPQSQWTQEFELGDPFARS